MMEKYELQKLRDLPIEGVAERLGLQVSRHKCLCPFHDDKHPSLSFRVSKNTFRCFVCGASGGTIDLVMRHLHMDFKEACRWLASENNVIIIENEKRSMEHDAEQKPFDASRYERYFERPWLSPEARKFLFEERRIDPRVVRWCRLTSWKDKQGVPWLQIPYYNKEGKLVGVQNRNLSVSGSKVQDSGSMNQGSRDQGVQGVQGNQEVKGVQAPRFRFPQGSQCGIYNLPVMNLLKPGDELYITEGCSDCWAMLSAGHKAIAIPSATLLTQKDIEQLSWVNNQSSIVNSQWSMVHGQSSITFHMYPDRDEPGERLFLQLQKVLPSLVHHQLPLGCKDYSEYYLKLKS
jgi:hypothetical protein